MPPLVIFSTLLSTESQNLAIESQHDDALIQRKTSAERAGGERAVWRTYVRVRLRPARSGRRIYCESQPFDPMLEATAAAPPGRRTYRTP